MRQYVKVAKHYCLDKSSLQFVHLLNVGDCILDILPFETDAIVTYGCYARNINRVSEFKLRTFSLKFGRSVEEFTFDYLDKQTDKAKIISAASCTRMENNSSTMYSQYYMKELDVTTSHYRLGLSRKAFGRSRELVYPYYEPFKCIGYGLSPHQWNIRYNGKNLGESFAFVLGTSVILLDDDLCFDTFAVVTGITSDTITIDKFLHTVNPFVVKCMVFGG